MPAAGPGIASGTVLAFARAIGEDLSLIHISLRMDGNHSKSAKAEGSLTATPTGGAGTKVGLSDPVSDGIPT